MSSVADEASQLRAELAAAMRAVAEAREEQAQGEAACRAHVCLGSQEAREEQREQDCRALWTKQPKRPEDRAMLVWAESAIRAAPLDATPLKERIEELEQDVAEGENYLHEATLQIRSLEAERDALKAQLATFTASLGRDPFRIEGDLRAQRDAAVGALEGMLKHPSDEGKQAAALLAFGADAWDAGYAEGMMGGVARRKDEVRSKDLAALLPVKP